MSLKSLKPRNLIHSSGGFTLVEVLVALAIIGLVASASVKIFTAAGGYITGAGKETVGVQVARESIEHVKSMSPDEIAGYTLLSEPGLTEDYGQMEKFPGFKRVTRVSIEELNITGVPAAIARITVTVFWNGEINPLYERSIAHETLHFIN